MQVTTAPRVRPYVTPAPTCVPPVTSVSRDPPRRSSVLRAGTKTNKVHGTARTVLLASTATTASNQSSTIHHMNAHKVRDFFPLNKFLNTLLLYNLFWDKFLNI